MFRWDIVNAVADEIGAERYLEIGVAAGESMRAVRIAEKWGVDTNPQPSGTQVTDHLVVATSDQFFALPGLPKFDVVFIDGWHQCEQVLRDVEGALGCLSSRGVVVLHDCNPEHEYLQTRVPTHYLWTGDCWRAAAQLRAQGRHTLRVVATDFGVGILLPDRPESALNLGKPWSDLSWPDLDSRRSELLGLVAPEAWLAWFRSAVRPAMS